MSDDGSKLAKSEAARERLGRALSFAEARLSKLTSVCACGAESERVGPWRCTKAGCEVGDLLDHEANALVDEYTASLRERLAAAEADAAAWKRGVEAANRIAQRERERAERAEAIVEDVRAAAVRHATICPLRESNAKAKCGLCGGTGEIADPESKMVLFVPCPMCQVERITS